MNYSYWEQKTWLSDIDFTIIGSGIVGLSCALELRKRFPISKILVLEKGMLPQGASTKNAGFACFGSLSEIIEDLKTLTEEEVCNLIDKRVRGLAMLRSTLGDKNIDFQLHGGYELFLKNNSDEFGLCADQITMVNNMLRPLFNEDIYNIKPNNFQFKNIVPELIYNQFEGQLDTGKMMDSFLRLAQSKGIRILNNIMVKELVEISDSVLVNTSKFQLKSSKVFVATNGFASNLINASVKPARAQVLITKPIKNLHIKGTFHINKGYYYFRNIDNRILFGGGRELDFQTETTTEFGLTEIVQNQLEKFLRQIILPNTEFEIHHRWSGIMGVGQNKKTIVEPLGNNIYCGVRLGGMGVAIGSLIGKELAGFA